MKSVELNTSWLSKYYRNKIKPLFGGAYQERITMIFINRSELNRMAKKVVDSSTGMTELDRFENEHCYEDWHIIEDEEK